ncbi:MAG TPA: IS630 family transposase [Polyangiaceae bacterium]|nr:IS630 family transposase [Polyangiaceae bacterium]
MARKKLIRGRPKAELVLTSEQRETLRRYERGRTVSQALALRARIILLCSEGRTNEEVAAKVDVWGVTVGKWRSRFVRLGVDGLLDSPRPNVHRKLTDEKVEAVVRLALETTPKGRTHWSTRPMGKRAGVSQSSVSRIWRAFQLKPHRRSTFTLSPDNLFVEKVRDIVGLYMSPPEHAVVLCLDEKPQVQALERHQPVLPMVLGRAERYTHTYTRHGTTNLFAALDVASGKVIGECYPRKRAAEFRRFLGTVGEQTPEALVVHVVVDNSSIHSAPTVRRWLKLHPRFRMHFTPTYSSWLNLVERWFSGLTNQALRRGSHTSIDDLRNAIETYLEATNDEPKPFVWTKTADEILTKVARHAQRTIADRNS